MIDEPKPEKRTPGEKYLTSKERVDQLRRDFKFIDTEPSGVHYYQLPNKEYISDAKHLAGGSLKDSYDAFFELLISIPVLTEVVGKYLKKYRYDLINRQTPGLTQPRIIQRNNGSEINPDIYTTVDNIDFNYTFPTREDIEEEIERRKKDYTNIICILWLINLLRSNVPTYRRMGIFNNTVIPRKHSVLDQFYAIRSIIQDAYQPELTEIILKEVFAILNIKPHEFLIDSRESSKRNETDGEEPQEP